MPLRILHSIASINPAGGGPIEWLSQLAKVADERGHAMEAVSLDDPRLPWVGSCPMRCHALGPGWLGYGYTPRLAEWMRARHGDYDVVVINGLWQYHSLGVWRGLRGSSTPYVVYPHGMLGPWFKRTYPLKHLKKCLYWAWGDYRVLRDARAVIYTCEEERRLARESFRRYRARERVAPLGVPEPDGDSARQRAAFLQRFPAAAGKRCLLFLGRIHEVKGVELLLQALHAMSGKERMKDVHLVVAGPDDRGYGERMKGLAASLRLEERITWTGRVTGDLKWGALRAAEAFILPSHHENFGIAVVESLACGVPVLISDQVNIWREIDADGAGYVDHDSVEGVERLLSRWLGTESEEWRKMGEAARRSFARRFGLQGAAEAFLTLMAEVGGAADDPARH